VVIDENSFERNDVIDMCIDATTVGSGIDKASDRRDRCVQWHLALDFCVTAKRKERIWVSSENMKPAYNQKIRD